MDVTRNFYPSEAEIWINFRKVEWGNSETQLLLYRMVEMDGSFVRTVAVDTVQQTDRW